MRRGDDDERKLRPRSRARKGGERFVTQVLKAAGGARMLGVGKARTPAFGPRPSRGRGATIARLKSGSLAPRSRRVIVKAKLVNLGKAGASATLRHLRYLQREGVAREGDQVRAYGPQVDEADTRAFEERGRGDRHQFRFIVSPEDGTALGDLRDYTRTLMAQVEKDLGTRLDWVAVDHWDTDNPHTHIVLRGKTDRGENLVIAREYIAEGMRTRAAELATEWLGLRTEREIQARLERDVKAMQRTGLDRSLERLAEDRLVDLRVVPGEAPARQRRALLIGRLQRLTQAGLADGVEPGVWRLHRELGPRLDALGERLEIATRVARAVGESRQCAVFTPARSLAPLVGRIAGKGLADEFTERGYLVVEGVEGHTHYVALGPGTDLSELPRGGIVEISGRTAPRAVDETIVRVAGGGHYHTGRHREEERRRARPGQDPEAFVQAHVRRLEALRRAGIVERVSDGIWQVPADLPAQGLRYDRSRDGGVIVTLHSALPIERQTRALGATWLDAQVLDRYRGVGGSGFGAEVRRALAERATFLFEQGLAERRDGRLFAINNLSDVLRTREVDHVATDMAQRTGLHYRPAVDGRSVSGILREQVQLVSGRFALIQDGMAFSLVPWSPVLENRIGRSISGVVRGDEVSWRLSRELGIGM